MKMYSDLMVFTQEIIYKHSINGQSTDNELSYVCDKSFWLQINCNS